MLKITFRYLINAHVAALNTREGVLKRDEYLAVRRAYNLVRKETPVAERITFEEMALLSHLEVEDAELPTSFLADYQGVLRPTMTHRTNHLFSLGCIARREGTIDRRNVCCSITDKGRKLLDELLSKSCRFASKGEHLSRIRPERMLAYADAMGTLSLGAAELTLIALVEKGPLSVSGLVDALGVLQPTASMAVMRLEEAGFVSRTAESDARTILVTLTEAGRAEAESIGKSIDTVIVRRSRKD